ncbi:MULTISPECIES: hypothetical protein [Neorhizobium]|jgi:hypothetical protein|uniref:hypothetical protein n=1 Tax=Neorhizobium sp. T7_12 TaxID=2093832 RepID=UPI00155EF8F4|nr:MULTISPECIES: hypothetical protein [Neorhizobium]
MKSLMISVVALATLTLLPTGTFAEDGEYYEGILPPDAGERWGSTDRLHTGSTTRYGMPSPFDHHPTLNTTTHGLINSGDYYEGAERPD